MSSGKNRRSVKIAAVTALVGATVLFPSSLASAVVPPVQIQPVVSNLAGKAWVTFTASSGRASAALAGDSNESTAWVAERREGAWLKLDLGGAYDNIRKVRVIFPTAGATYRYLVQAETSAKSWTTVADHSHNVSPGAGGVDVFTQAGTVALRVVILSASRGAVIGVSEFAAYNYLRSDLALGADLSYADQDTNQDGRTFYVDDPSTATDVLTSARDAGMRYIRLRVFNDPRDEKTGAPVTPAYQGPTRTLAVAQHVRDLGMGLGIDLHYSDSWADPSKQAKPTTWATLPFDQLVTHVYDYTHDYIEQLVAQGTVPAKVAVGNELINGFLWGSERPQPWFTNPSDWCYTCYFNQDPTFVSQPGGGILWNDWQSSDPAARAAYNASWDRFTTLQAAGIKAVRDVAASHGVHIGIETHVIIDQGKLDKTREFWNQFLRRLKAKGQDIDVMGFSYYSEWHGSPDVFGAELETIATDHPGYKIDIAETSHPAVDWSGATTVPNSPDPISVQGQADALQRVFAMVNDLPDNRGLGALVWEPSHFQDMVSWSTSHWPVLQWNQSIKVYGNSDARSILQDTVYSTARVGEIVTLPASVNVLDVATGVVSQTHVIWDTVADGTTAQPDRVTLHGTSPFGAVTAVVDVMERHRPH